MPPPKLITPVLTTNWMPFVLVSNSNGISIAPRPTPMRAIAATTTLIGIVFVAFGIVTYYKAVWAGAFWFALGLGVLTTVGTPLVILFHFRRQQRLGPVLVFDSSQKTLNLPRLSKHFRADEVDCFCLVIASAGGDWSCQLQLHTHEGGRFLLVSAWSRRELEPMLRRIVSQVPAR